MYNLSLSQGKFGLHLTVELRQKHGSKKALPTEISESNTNLLHVYNLTKIFEFQYAMQQSNASIIEVFFFKQS